MKSFAIATLFAVTSLASVSLAQAPNKDLFEKACTACHGVEPISAMTGTKEEWGDVVDDMIAKGAEISNTDKDKIVAYLVATYPKKKLDTVKPAPKKPAVK